MRSSADRGTEAGRLWVPLVATALVTCLAAVMAVLIYGRVIRLDLPVSWDEAAHSLFGVAIANDLRQGDLVAFAYDTYRQVYWPPLHSWIVGVAFVLFGERIEVARSVSLAAYFVAPLALLAAARVMHARDDAFNGWLAAGIAGTLAVIMPAMIPFASLAFLDLPALVAVMLTLLASFYAERNREVPARRVWVAAGILAAFFLKTNYGVLLMVVFAIDALIDASVSPRRLFTRRNGYVVVPVVIVLAVWFAYPPKLASTIRAMVNRPAGADPWTLDGLMFYPRTLVTFAGSWVVLAAAIAAMVAGWSRRREPNVRLLLVLAITQFILGQIHHTKEDRHILPIFPAMVLLTAVAGAGLLGRARADARLRAPARLLGGAAVVVAVAQLFVLVSRPLPTWRLTPTDPLGEPNRVLRELIASAVAKGERVLLIGTLELEPGPPVTDWDLVVNHRLLSIERSGGIGVFDRDRAVAASVARLPMPGWVTRPVLRVLRRGDLPVAVRTLYTGLPERVDSAQFARSVAATVRAGVPHVVMVASALGDSVRYGSSYLAPAIDSASLQHVGSRDFDGEPGTRIDVYRPVERR